MIFKFDIPGRPAPKGSRVSGVTRDGRRFSRESNPAAQVWAKLAKAELRRQALEQRVDPLPKNVPVVVHVAFVYERPKKPTYTYPAGPDLDKLCRNLGDQLTGIAFEDDTQVVRWEPIKMFSDSGSASHTRGWVTPA